MTSFLYGEAGLLLMSRLQRSGNNFRLMSAHYMYGLNVSDQAKKGEPTTHSLGCVYVKRQYHEHFPAGIFH
jgi:hypothetical protein